MKKLTYLLLVSLLAACNVDNDNPKPGSGDEWPNSHWGKPHTVTEYGDAGGSNVYKTTTYFYDQLGRQTGYRRVSSSGSTLEDMVGSKYDGRTHTYEIHSYEWVGATLPMVFYYTDSYTDSSFSTLEKRYMKAKSTDWEETTTYDYEGGRMTGYRTVETGQHPEEFYTRVTYHYDPFPSAKLFPQEAADGAERAEMFYTNGDGDRTGYYNDNDYCRAQWNFNYGNGYCTYYTSQNGRIHLPQLVRVVFYPEQ